MKEKMKVMAVREGKAEMVLVDKPIPQNGEVRIKIVASSVNPAEEKVVSGDFVGRFLHAKTTPLVVGWDFSGTVDAIGEGVIDIEIGTAVWGHLAFSMTQKQGSFSEYITISRKEIAIKPEKVSHQLAAASATVAMTSLQSLRDLGKCGNGSEVLIVGAGGGIGSISVGIAKRLGATVTTICSTKDVERIKDLGADFVIDRKKENPLKTDQKYDIIFDTPAVYSYSNCSSLLKSGGTYVTTLPGLSLFTGKLSALISGKNCQFVQVSSKQNDLELVGKWLADGLEVKIDSEHKILELDNALKQQLNRERSGRVVVNIANEWPDNL